MQYWSSYKVTSFWREAPADNTGSGQSQFTTLKLRSLALVPSSGQKALLQTPLMAASLTRLFPPRRCALVRDSWPFRAALRALKRIRSRDCVRTSCPQTLAGLCPSGSPWGENIAREMSYLCDRRCTRHRLRRNDNAWLRLERSAPIRVVNRSGSGR